MNQNVSEIQKELIIFDVGGVLVKLSYGNMYEAAARVKGCGAEEFRDAYLRSGLEPRVLRGEITSEEFFAEFGKMVSPHGEISREELRAVLFNCWREQVDGAVELKRRLHENGYPVAILSNIYSLCAEIISERFPDVLNSFGGPKIYSCEVKAVKPEPRIYDAVDNAHGGPKILIEDKESYLMPAVERGWKGILFTPAVDESEAIRAVAGHNTKTRPEGIAIADSVGELYDALRRFGVEI